MHCLYTGKRQTMENITFYLLKSVQNINNSSNVPFGRPQSGTVIIQLMTELDVSDNYISTGTAKPNRLESKASHVMMHIF